MTNLDSIIKSKDITLLTEFHIDKPMVFPVVLQRCEIWIIKKAEHGKIEAFDLCWRRFLRVPWTARRSKQGVLKEINHEYSLEGWMLELQHFGHLIQTVNSLENILMLGKFSSVTHVLLFLTLCTEARQASLSITNSLSLLKLMSIESVIPSNRLILCHSLLLPSILSSIRVIPNESVLCTRQPKYWHFSFSISPPVNIQD